jgi:hypothetical protein
MGGKSESNQSSVQSAYDQRSFTTIDDRDFTRIDNTVNNDNRQDNRIKDAFNTVNNFTRQDDNSVRDAFNTTNTTKIDARDQSDRRISDAFNTSTDNSRKLEEGAIYAGEGGSVSVTNQVSDNGAIAAAFNFAKDFSTLTANKAQALEQAAIGEAFKSTVGGLENQQAKWMAAISMVAVVAVVGFALKR